MKVSICVPVYGVELYIEKCARSLFEQTYEDIEYIFVDDGSPDRSIFLLEEIIKSYPKKKDNVHIIHHVKNEGIAVARNTAIDNSTSDFVYFVDADDYIEYDTIACLIETQKETSADIVSARMVRNEGDIDERFVEPMYRNKDEMLQAMLGNVWHHELCNRLIRRSLFVDNNIKAIPHVNLCEDWQIVPRLVFYADSCVTISKNLYHYSYNPNSLTHSNNAGWESEKQGYYQEYLSLMLLLDFFRNTKFYKTIASLFLRRQADNIDLAVRHRDKIYFSQCRSYILSVERDISAISKGKMLCIQLGYSAMRFFLFLHDMKKKQ